MKKYFLEPMLIPMIFRSEKSPKFKKELSNRKLKAIFWENLLNFVLNFYLSRAHVAPKFVTTKNCFYHF